MAIAVFGEALIDLIVGDDGAYRPHLGGSPYNVAIGLARQGVDVSYLSSLSDDNFGDQLLGSLLKEGVQVPLNRRSLWPSSLALVTIDEQHQPDYRLYREGIADKDTSFEEIVGNLPENLRIFHTGSLAITPSQLPKVRRVFDLMREQGVLISIDINIRIRASVDREKYIDGVRSLLPMADIVKASDEDLLELELDADVRASAEIVSRDMGNGLLVLTEGNGGAVVYSGQGVVTRPAYRVSKVIDTVGAGDTFHSAFLAYLIRQWQGSTPTISVDLEVLGQALNYACAAAAINVSRAGCSPPSDKEVLGFIAAAKF